MTQVMIAVSPSKKRKRNGAENSTDSGGSKNMSSTNGDHANGEANAFQDNSSSVISPELQGVGPNEMSSTAAAALSAQLNNSDNQNLSFVSTDAGADERPGESFDSGEAPSMQNAQNSPYSLAPYTPGVAGTQMQTAGAGTNGSAQKPLVGTEEWHKVRRDNHKEGSSVSPHLVPLASAPY